MDKARTLPVPPPPPPQTLNPKPVNPSTLNPKPQILTKRISSPRLETVQARRLTLRLNPP